MAFDFRACIHLVTGHDDQGTGRAACVRILGETNASGTLNRDRYVPATLPPTERQPFENIVVVALIIALVPRYIPRWLCG
jgi:hypothetical protein